MKFTNFPLPKVPVIIILSIFLVTILGIVLFDSKEQAGNQEIGSENKKDSLEWLTYKNDTYKFSIEYPANWEKFEGKSFQYIPVGTFSETILLEDKNSSSDLDWLRISITDQKIYDLTQRIDQPKNTPIGESVSVVHRVDEVNQNGLIMHKGSFETVLSEKLYFLYIPLGNSGESLFLHFYLDETQQDELLGKIINSLQIDPSLGEYVPSREALENFYYSVTVGESTIVYLFESSAKTPKELFLFKNIKRYGPEGKSLFFTPLISYSPTRNEIAYANEDGLFIYSITDHSSRQLISKTDSDKNIDGIPIPEWSNPGISEYALKIFDPIYSNDGKYLLFFAGYYEGIGTYILDLSTQIIQEFRGESGYISSQNFAWSDTGHTLVEMGGQGYGEPGLHVVENERFNQANEVLHLENEIFSNISLFPQADMHFLDNQRVVFTLVAYLNNEPIGYDTMSVNIDGSDSSVLHNAKFSTKIENVVPQGIIFSTKSSSDFETFWLLNETTKKSRFLFSEDQSHQYKIEGMHRDLLSVMEHDQSTEQTKLSFYSFTDEAFIDEPLIISESGTVQFIGTSN